MRSRTPRPPSRLKSVDEFSLHDAEALRMVLRSGSVVDWHRLNLQSIDEAHQLLENHALDLEDPGDLAYIDQTKTDAIAYLRRNFTFAIPKPVERASLGELMVMASGKGHRQLCACTILKAVQTINHLASRELLFRLPVSDRDLFHLVEEKVYRVVGGMLSEGYPITEFVGGRKNLDSMYTKLLSKADATTAAIYDKLRFRIVTRTRKDLLPILQYLTQHLFPFNFVVPGQSVNSLLNFTQYCKDHPHLSRFVSEFQGKTDDVDAPAENRFSAPNYRVINFVTDVPVRVPPHVLDQAPPGTEHLGRVVYMFCEFQLLDQESEASNEQGDASHEAYKARQRHAVARRLRLGARSVDEKKKKKKKK